MTHLWACLRLIDPLAVLPSDVGRSLTLAHHKKLYEVADPHRKVALAKRALQRRWSSRDLGERVRA